MSVSEKVKCIDGRNKTLSINRQCELLQLPRSSYYRPRSSLAEGSDNLELMRLIDEEFLRHPFYGSRKMKDYLNQPQRYSCKPQTDPTLDAFTGTPLRKVCEELGFVEKTEIVKSMVANGSILDMPQFRRSEVSSLCKTFNMYINYPDNRWPDIKKAEADIPEGRKSFEKLKKEFIGSFWEEDSSFESSASAGISPFS